MSRVLRHLSVVTGGLMVFWSVLVWLFYLVLHDPGGTCVSGQAYVSDICWNVWRWAVIPAAIGGLVAMIGAVRFQSPPRRAHEMMRIGAVSRLVLACLLSVAVVGFAGIFVTLGQEAVEGETLHWTIMDGSVEFARTTILGMFAGVGLLAFLVGSMIHWSYSVKRARFLSKLRAREAARGRGAVKARPRNAQ